MPIHVKIISARSRKPLDVPSSSEEDLVQIQQFTDNGGRNQSWALWPLANTLNSFQIQSDLPRGLVLDAEGSGRVDHTRVVQFPFNNTPNQYWTFERVGNVVDTDPAGLRPIFVIWPGHANNQLVLDVTGGGTEDGAKIQLFARRPLETSQNQQWIVEATRIEL